MSEIMFRIGWFIVGIAGLHSALFGQGGSGDRVKQNFDESWQFHLGDIAIKKVVKAGGQGGITDGNVQVVTAQDTLINYLAEGSYKFYNQAQWKLVNLPHDWAVEGTFVHNNSLGNQPGVSGYLPTGIGFYRKEFKIPKEDIGKKISIEFDGIFRNSTVWVNGHLLGNHLSGYTPSHYDLTDVLRYGDEGTNIILVKVDATEYEGWWYEGAGIYRHVWLVKTNRLHVKRFGTFVSTPVVSDQTATLAINTTVKNENNSVRNLSLVSNVFDNKGNLKTSISAEIKIQPHGELEINQAIDVNKPSLWSPEMPTLYRLVSLVIDEGIVLDTYETTFGIRVVEINKHGVFLNGKLYPVKGTCNHQDFAGVGVALPDKINWYKLKLLKEVGSNAYRCSHHPPTPEVLDMCDSMGLLVLNENRFLSSSKDGLDDLKEMLYRDRNHPSIFMWSMENEEWIQGTVQGARILETMVSVTHSIDPTRKVTAAMNHGRNEGGYSEVMDVVGYNYGDKQLAYVKDREQFPERVMFCTESTSFVSTRGEYASDWEKAYVSNTSKWEPNWGPFPGEDWADIVKYPYLGGTFVWTGFDYRGEPTPFQWPSVTSHFGFMDICGFPKDGYYAYKAAWTKTPVVHLFPHWNWPDKIGDSIGVHCYTNCDEVELFLNGKSIGRKKAEPYTKVVWTVIYKPGKLEAIGYKSGKPAIKDVVETTTVPSKIEMVSDDYRLKADGCDVAIIKVAIKDAKGRVVPTASNLVQFTIEGPGTIIGTGNGNPTSHEPDKSNQRKAFNGYCLVLVQSRKEAGEIKLKATGQSLSGTEVVLIAE